MFVRFIWLLTLLFIGLKLTNFINWGWLLVISPPFVYIILYTIIFTIYSIYLYKNDPLKFKIWCITNNINIKGMKK